MTRFSLALSVLLAGCYSSTFVPCTIACGASDPMCPDDMACGSDGYCHGPDDEACERTPDPKTGLLAWWNLDELGGVSAADSAGQNHGTLHGATFSPSDGKFGGALVLDGASAFVDYGDSSTLDLAANAPFTVAAWIETTDEYGIIVSMRHVADDAAALDLSVGYDGAELKPGAAMALVRGDTGTGHANISGAIVNDGRWHHVAVTRDVAGTITLYVDAVAQGSASGNTSAGSITTNRRRIGSDYRWSINPAFQQYDKLAGLVDDVRFYARELTEGDIADLVVPGFQ